MVPKFCKACLARLDLACEADRILGYCHREECRASAKVAFERDNRRAVLQGLHATETTARTKEILLSELAKDIERLPSRMSVLSALREQVRHHPYDDCTEFAMERVRILHPGYGYDHVSGYGNQRVQQIVQQIESAFSGGRFDHSADADAAPLKAAAHVAVQLPARELAHVQFQPRKPFKLRAFRTKGAQYVLKDARVGLTSFIQPSDLGVRGSGWQSAPGPNDEWTLKAPDTFDTAAPGILLTFVLESFVNHEQQFIMTLFGDELA